MKNKIERYLLLLLILLLPTQLGHYFFGDFSFIDGFRVDYLAPFLGLFDCVFLVLFVFKLIKLMQPKKLKRISFYLVCIFQTLDIMQRRNDSGQAGMTNKFAKQLAMGMTGAILLIMRFLDKLIRAGLASACILVTNHSITPLLWNPQNG